MKRKQLIGSVTAFVLGMSLCSYQLGRYQTLKERENKVAYIEQTDSDRGVPDEQLLSTHVSDKEAIDAEYIVVKITDSGYVTSHGDHFHYYNGKVPFDALFSEELIMRDPNYSLQEEHIINEVQDGYVIKVNGQYYVYLKNPEQRKNIRSKEEIARQKTLTTTDRKHQATETHHQEGYRTDDGYVFNPTDVIEDTGDGFIVPHGAHFHFIPKQDLSAAELKAAQDYWNNKKSAISVQINRPSVSPISVQKDYVTVPENDLESLLRQLDATPISQRYTEMDGLVFNPRAITKKTATGVIVPHGDHYHFIPYAKLSDLERRIAQMIGVHVPMHDSVPNTPVGQPETSNDNKQLDSTESKHDQDHHSDLVNFLSLNIVKSEKGRDGQPYATSDGYVFDATSIVSYDDQGLIAGHGEHEHYIFYHELDDNELQLAQDYINSVKLAKTNTSSFTKEEIAAKLQFASLQSAFPIEKLLVTGNKVIIPHGNHSHTVDLARYPTKLRIADFATEEEYKVLLMQLKLGSLKLKDGVRDVYRDNDKGVVVYSDGRREVIPLAEISLPLDYEETSYDSFIETKSLRDLKLDYIAEQYGVGLGQLFPVLGGKGVMVNRKEYVDLALVDIHAPVIYTLLEKEEAEKTVEEDENVAPTSESTISQPIKEDTALDSKPEDSMLQPTEKDDTVTSESSITQPNIFPTEHPLEEHVEHKEYLLDEE
ncbi:TPA: pneumococcal-type histidine triad protein [Streptococcus suis]|nr:pneumococcal-type histidine triad protein [Streptococcus suis]